MASLFANLARLFTGHRPAATPPATGTPPWENAPPSQPRRPAKALVARPAQQRPLVPQAPRPAPTQPKPDRIGLVGFHEHGFVIARPAEPFAPWLVERSQTLRQRLGGRTNIADGLR
ncbi:MAG: hypothetical protein P9E67_09740 [Candidatus Competibacter sp.]|nr:hypothetical protein [Candidatus Competibacter sp.]